MNNKPRLFVPHGRQVNTGTKNRDGLYIGAVVLVENSGYGPIDERRGMEQPLTALVLRVYPDDEPTSGDGSQSLPWTGDRPFIDVVGVHVAREGVSELVRMTKVPYIRDVSRQARLAGVPGEAVTWPGYRVVTKLEGIR